MFPFRRRSLLASAVALVASTPSLQADEVVTLDNLVVTASGFEQKLTNAPASISVISQQDLQQKRYNSLAHALGDVEGIDIGQGTGKTGGLNISIRGMPSEYTLILIDGRRQNAAGNVTPNGFNETSTSFIPPLSAIERIEVIRGPMSTLYGSDAMGGEYPQEGWVQYGQAVEIARYVSARFQSGEGVSTPGLGTYLEGASLV